ncbi:hypothetical protein [Cronobacter dublinensis]|uniref:hypothetical protein n=1 Tax=Cronobacter dublinensis TaxID=413497 RepID=UPI00300DFB82
MRFLEILGLEAGADERAVKRAYAKQLKTCRPDEDPQGFQTLRDAYEEALEYARARWGDDEPTHAMTDAPFAPQDVVQAASPADVAPRFDDDGQSVSEPESTRPPGIDPAPPLTGSAPPRVNQWLDGLTEENLNARWLEARAMGEGVAFEKGVLARCLSHFSSSESGLAASAQALFQWLTAGQTLALDTAQQTRLRGVLLAPFADEMAAALAEGQDARYLAQLRALTHTAWLQSYDGQLQLQRLALTLLDDMPDWSTERFAALCALFHWDEARGERPDLPELWARAVARDEDERLFATLSALRDAPDDTSAHRAARMVLGAQDEDARMLAGLDYTDDDWSACAQLTDRLEIGHPALIPRFAGADIHAWEQTSAKLTNTNVPMLRGLWFIGLMMATFGWMLPAIYDGTITPLGVVLRVLVAPVVAMVVGAVPLALWSGFTRSLSGTDTALSERLLPRFIYSPRRKRWRLLAHVIPFCVVSLVIALVCGRLALGIFVVVTLLLAWTDLWRYAGALQRFRKKPAPKRTGMTKNVLLALLFFAIITGVRALLPGAAQTTPDTPKTPSTVYHGEATRPDADASQATCDTPPAVPPLCRNLNDPQACSERVNHEWYARCASK